MTKDIPMEVMVVAIILVVVVLGYLGYRAACPATAPPGSYTPGKPPWQDPKFAAEYKSGKLHVGESLNDWHPPAGSMPAKTASTP